MAWQIFIVNLSKDLLILCPILIELKKKNSIRVMHNKS